MKKIVIIVVIISLLILGSWIIKKYIGDIRPVFFTPAKKNSLKAPKPKLGESLDFPLIVPSDFQIGLFATNLGQVRDLAFSPGGVLIASIPDSGKVIMLPDRNKDGIADETDTIVSGLQKPHGIAFYGNFLYIAEEQNVSRYLWTDQALIGGIARVEKKLFDLPKGGRHFTRSIVFDSAGKMYVSIGSSCDVCYEKHQFLGSVIISNSEGIEPKIFAKGLRNSPFITINSLTQELWGTEMGRDFLGDNLPPDEINIIKSGSNYGWPFCYGNKIHDSKFDKNIYADDPCLNSISPAYEIPAHSAPLGLNFIKSDQFPSDWQNDLLVAYHGSWNRSSPVGYKVVRLHSEKNVFEENDFLTGFLSENGAFGRPVDIEFDKSGNLYVSDDKSGSIYIISKK